MDGSSRVHGLTRHDNYSYDVFVPRVKAFGGYTPFQRAALVAVAFCIPSPRIRKHSDVYNELNVAHVSAILV